jgi:hypothetical protein
MRTLRITLALLLGSLFLPVVAQRAAVAQVPNRVVLVIMENHAYGEIHGSSSAPYMNNTFAPAGKLLTNYFAIDHPSLPNYLDLTAGTDGGCGSDSCSRDSITANNIFHQLSRAGYGWQAWMESMGTNCRTSDTSSYVVHHNPPPYFTDLMPKSCAKRDIPYPSTLPTPLKMFTWISPNNDDNMHDGTIAQGDTWLSNHVPALLATGATVIIVFDEDDGSQSNHVWCAMVGPGITAGSSSNTAYTHFGLLAGLETHFGLSLLGSAASATAVPIP